MTKETRPEPAEPVPDSPTKAAPKRRRTESEPQAVKGQPYALHWFRRDLRVAGNEALHRQREEFDGRVVGVFCFDKHYLARPDIAAVRFQFILETLKALREELRAIGSDLLFLDVSPDNGFQEIFEVLKQAGQHLPQSVSFSRDYEPYATDRDQRLQRIIEKQGVSVYTARDHVLIEPHEIVKPAAPNAPYSVYSPYARKWREVFQTPEVQRRIKFQTEGLEYLNSYRDGKAPKLFHLTWSDLVGDRMDPWAVYEKFSTENKAKVKVEMPEAAGSLAALARVEMYRKLVDQYDKSRNVLSQDGTSRFSMFFKNGSLTVPQVISAYGLDQKKITQGRDKFLAELIWREFAYYILAKNPRVEHEAYDTRYKSIPWDNKPEWLQAWKDGMTGFPIVDAGMRQLNKTGWMHNRLRMIVASFLTKDLHINWQLGEQYFMERLIDGDLASNNLGWQWAASTGCDAQPYFRVFNPMLQQKKFDPDCRYIKTYLPELSKLSAASIHNLCDTNRPSSYPRPVVDHFKQRGIALTLYKPVVSGESPLVKEGKETKGAKEGREIKPEYKPRKATDAKERRRSEESVQSGDVKSSEDSDYVE